jgi:hypothetical protein
MRALACSLVFAACAAKVFVLFHQQPNFLINLCVRPTPRPHGMHNQTHTHTNVTFTRNMCWGKRNEQEVRGHVANARLAASLTLVAGSPL